MVVPLDCGSTPISTFGFGTSGVSRKNVCGVSKRCADLVYIEAVEQFLRRAAAWQEPGRPERQFQEIKHCLKAR
jgi:hypothetical protein